MLPSLVTDYLQRTTVLSFQFISYTNGSDGLEVNNMAHKQEVNGSNPRLCRIFLKHRIKRAAQL